MICAACGFQVEGSFRFCPECGTQAQDAAPPREQRKTVTVLFCDVAGSTALGESLDPEALRARLAGYFERMKAIITRHGGSVEKFIGDAVMAVFGVPVVHEDDALRACRAAVEMRDALPEVGVPGRIGVMTGEVVTGTAERLATGDAVNVAARLQQAAGVGEILLGAETVRLLGTAAEVEPLEPLEVKGKAAPVAAYRLLGVGPEPQRRVDRPMIGRGRERALLRDAWARVLAGNGTQLFTILGAPGVGKSRLAADFLASVDGARVLRGHCLSYGEAITYWPVVNIAKPLLGDDARGALAELGLGDDVSGPLLALLRETGAAATTPQEIAWAVRRLLEAEAARTPVVVLFDDIHRGEPSFLDLIDHVADLARDARILLLCLARPELLERRAGWGGGKVNATTVLLDALDAEETERLIDGLLAGDRLDDATRAQIRTTAAGNPLFVEEMLALARESEGGSILRVPPTIQALLAARVDALDPRERLVLECGAVAGQTFDRAAVEALIGSDARVELDALVVKELVRAERGQVAGGDAYRFRHLLIRDAAYDALPKSRRAELHERLAAWIDERAGALVEHDELAAIHLEQAHRYRAELGLPDAELRARAERRLAVAGSRAAARGDMPAAADLFRRAVSLDEERGEGYADLALALAAAEYGAGRLDEADAWLQAAIESSARETVRLRAAIEQTRVRVQTGKVTDLEALPAAARDAVSVFEDAGDDLGLAKAWLVLTDYHNTLMQGAQWEAAAERALEHASRAGSSRDAGEARTWIGVSLFCGPRPVREAIARCEELLAGSEGPLTEAGLSISLGALRLLNGEIDSGRSIYEHGHTLYRDLGMPLWDAGSVNVTAFAELCIGEYERAELLLRRGVDTLRAHGERGWLPTAMTFLARALCALERVDEAEALLREARDLGADGEDLWLAIPGGGVEARIRARRGDPGALARALGVVEVARRTDFLETRAAAALDLADVHRLLGQREDERSALAAARDLHEQKGNLVGAAAVTRRLADLDEQPVVAG